MVTFEPALLSVVVFPDLDAVALVVLVTSPTLVALMSLVVVSLILPVPLKLLSVNNKKRDTKPDYYVSAECMNQSG